MRNRGCEDLYFFCEYVMFGDFVPLAGYKINMFVPLQNAQTIKIIQHVVKLPFCDMFYLYMLIAFLSALLSFHQ